MAAFDKAQDTFVRQSPTFRAAADSYVKHGGQARYLKPIVEYFGNKPIAEIVPWDIKQMAMAIYPEPNYQNSTRNRQALTPARAVMMHAYERGWCNLIRLTRFKVQPKRRKTPASHGWMQVFMRQCERDGLQHLAAIVLFMSQTGARISEAVRLQWREVDLNGRTAILLKTKTTTNSVRHITDEMVSRMRSLSAAKNPEDRVFRYTSRHSVSERIGAVCERAGISYKSPMMCGRHAFATNAISSGVDIKTAMEAGDWKSSTVFLETYVHTRNAGRSVADRFNSLNYEADF